YIVGGGAGGRDGGVGGLDRLAGVGEEQRAGPGQLDAAVVPQEQRRADVALQGFDLRAQGWLSDSEPAGCAGGVSLFGYGYEVAQVVQPDRHRNNLWRSAPICLGRPLRAPRMMLLSDSADEDGEARWRFITWRWFPFPCPIRRGPKRSTSTCSGW